MALARVQDEPERPPVPGVEKEDLKNTWKQAEAKEG